MRSTGRARSGRARERHLARGGAQRPPRREPGAVDPRARRSTFVAALRPRRCIAGFDFSFGLPAWFAREHGCATIDEVWALAARDGEHWLAPTPPFWREPLRRAAATSASAGARRATRPRSRSSSSSATVRSARDRYAACRSSRGLRAAGFAIWPFDAPTDRTVVRDLPVGAPRHSSPHAGPFANDHERDAVVLGARDVGRIAKRSRRCAPRPIRRLASKAISGRLLRPRADYCFALSNSISAGTTLCTSPTMPRSATEKIGASPSLLTATMLSLFFMPTRCCVAPEMPSAM